METLTVTQLELDALNKFTDSAQGFNQSELLSRLYNNVNFFTKEEASSLKGLISKYSMSKFEALFHLAIDDEAVNEYTLVVERPFQVGDWVKNADTDSVGVIREITEDGYFQGRWYNSTLPLIKTVMNCKSYKFGGKLTSQEIALEKERIKWAELGREVDEYKIGDIVAKNGNIQEISGVLRDGWKIQTYSLPVYNDELTLVCPVERRMDT